MEAIRAMNGNVPPILIKPLRVMNTKEEEQLLFLALERDVNLFDINLVPFSIRNDESVCLNIAKRNGQKLSIMSLHMKGNENIVREAVKQNGMSLQFANYRLRRNREIVCLALDQNGMALQFAAKELRQDLDIVLRAVSQNGNAIRYAMCHRTKRQRSRRKVSLKLDPQVIEAAVKSGAPVAGYTKQVMSLRENPDIALQCLRNRNYISTISVKLMKDTIFAAIARQTYIDRQTQIDSIESYDYQKKAQIISIEALLSYYHQAFNKEELLKSIKEIPITLNYLDYVFLDDTEIMEQSFRYLDGSHISLLEPFFAKFLSYQPLETIRMELLLRSIKENVRILKYLGKCKVIENSEFMEQVQTILLSLTSSKPINY